MFDEAPYSVGQELVALVCRGDQIQELKPSLCEFMNGSSQSESAKVIKLWIV